MQVNILEAKTEFSKLIRLLETGKEDHIIVARYGKPVVKMTVYNDTPVSKRIGAAKGKLKSPDDLDQFWEVAIKHAIHPEHVTFTGKEPSQYCQEAGFLPVEMRDRHVFALETITRADDAPPHHNPFGRMLIAQAKAENMSFLTHDSPLPYYNEKCIISV